MDISERDSDKESINESDFKDESILFSCRCPACTLVDLHTHGHTQNLVWNLGEKALVGKDNVKSLEGPAKKI